MRMRKTLELIAQLNALYCGKSLALSTSAGDGILSPPKKLYSTSICTSPFYHSRRTSTGNFHHTFIPVQLDFQSI